MTVSAQIRSPESFATMIAGTEPRKIDAGVALLRQGERSDEAFVLTEGTVKVVAETAYGAVPLATIRALGLVGEMGALSGVPRTASIIAITPLTVHVVTRSHLSGGNCGNGQGGGSNNTGNEGNGQGPK